MESGSRTNSPTLTAIVPDGGWGWVVVFSSFMIHFIIDGITYTMGDIYLEPMLSKLRSNRGYVSAIFALLESITLISAPISTVFTNAFGSRMVTVVGAIIASLGFFLSRWQTNVYYYYFTIGIIGGIGCGLIYLPAIVSVGYYFERKRSFAMGIAVCGSGLGTFAFPFFMPWLIDWLFWNDYNGGLLFESGLIFTCVVFGLLMIPLPIEPSEQRRARLLLRSKLEQQGNSLESSIGTGHQHTNASAEQESLPFLTKTANSIINHGRRSSHDRRYTSPSFRHCSYVDSSISNSNSDPAWKSLSQIPSTYYPSRTTIQSNALYRGTLDRVTRSYTLNDADVRFTSRDDGRQLKSMKITDVETESIIGQLLEQINLNLMRNGAFALFIVSNFLSSLGFFVPYNFAHDLAKDAHVKEAHRKFVLMAIGIANCFGHVIIGYLADQKWVNRLALYNSTLIIAGLATIIAPYSGSHILPHIVYASFFGFFCGGYVGLTSIITVDLVGLDKLSNGMGIILLFQGVATALGTPIAGAIRDLCETHSRPFLWPYFIFGSFLALSGSILFAIPSILNRQNDPHKLTQQSSDVKAMSHEHENEHQQQQQQV